MLPLHVLPDQVLPVQLLSVHALPSQPVAGQAWPVHVWEVHALPVQLLPVHVLPDHVLPVQLLPVQLLPVQVLPFHVPPVHAEPVALAGRANGKDTRGLEASYVFEIDGAGTWTVEVAGGRVTVNEGDRGGDCTIRTSEKTFRRIVDGKQNPLTAYLTGKLKVSGDVSAAMKLKEVLV